MMRRKTDREQEWRSQQALRRRRSGRGYGQAAQAAFGGSTGDNGESGKESDGEGGAADGAVWWAIDEPEAGKHRRLTSERRRTDCLGNLRVTSRSVADEMVQQVACITRHSHGSLRLPLCSPLPPSSPLPSPSVHTPHLFLPCQVCTNSHPYPYGVVSMPTRLLSHSRLLQPSPCLPFPRRTCYSCTHSWPMTSLPCNMGALFKGESAGCWVHSLPGGNAPSRSLPIALFFPPRAPPSTSAAPASPALISGPLSPVPYNLGALFTGNLRAAQCTPQGSALVRYAPRAMARDSATHTPTRGPAFVRLQHGRTVHRQLVRCSVHSELLRGRLQAMLGLAIGYPDDCPPTVTHLPPTVTHLPPTVNHLSPTVTHLPPTVTHLPPTVNHLPPTVTHLPPTVTHLPPTVTHLPPTVTHLPPTVTHLPPTVTHLPPTVTHPVIAPSGTTSPSHPRQSHMLSPHAPSIHTPVSPTVSSTVPQSTFTKPFTLTPLSPSFCSPPLLLLFCSTPPFLPRSLRKGGAEGVDIDGGGTEGEGLRGRGRGEREVEKQRGRL
ncbi:unnamed protein product [Closterium sp. NIES-64]|nr:unnamed protein product [Closterium sp. NIES-64]